MADEEIGEDREHVPGPEPAGGIDGSPPPDAVNPLEPHAPAVCPQQRPDVAMAVAAVARGP